MCSLNYPWVSLGKVTSFIYLLLIYFKKFYCYSITVVCLFSPSLHPTPAEPISLPHLHPPPWYCPCVLYSSSCNPFSSLSPPHSPLASVRLFLTSMSLVIFCLLFSSIDYVPVRWHLMNLSQQALSSQYFLSDGLTSLFLWFSCRHMNWLVYSSHTEYKMCILKNWKLALWDALGAEMNWAKSTHNSFALCPFRCIHPPKRVAYSFLWPYV